MPTVFANGRSIVHKGDGQTDVSGPPDVCKTPSPGGPVPVPYVNVAKSSDLVDGTQSVKIEGNSVALGSSSLSTSTGDEPGSAGGIISSKTKGKLTWRTKSLDVIFEGEGVVRFGDVTLHNGNTANTLGVESGTPSPSYGADFTGLCPICNKGHDEHPELKESESRPTGKYVQAVIKALSADYTVAFRDKIAALEEERSIYKANEKAANEEAKTKSPVQKAEYIKAGLIFRAKRQATNAKIEALKGAPAVATAAKPAYVVGVMMCLDHTSTLFVAASGKNLKGFNRVVCDIPRDDLDCRSVEIVDSPGVGPESFVAKNGKADTCEKKAAVADAWRKAAKEAEELGAPEPGQCAAQQLLAKPGHRPMAMTEAYFSPKRDLQLRLKHIRDAVGFAEATKQQLRVNWSAVPERMYEHESLVPSCRTCQSLLPLALCDTKRSC